MVGMRHVADGLREWLRTMGAQRDMPAITREWDTLVGQRLAAHSRPTQLSASALVVQVDDPGWATELRFVEAQLVSALDALLKPGRVTSVRVVVKGT